MVTMYCPNTGLLHHGVQHPPPPKPVIAGSKAATITPIVLGGDTPAPTVTKALTRRKTLQDIQQGATVATQPVCEPEDIPILRMVSSPAASTTKAEMVEDGKGAERKNAATAKAEKEAKKPPAVAKSIVAEKKKVVTSKSYEGSGIVWDSSKQCRCCRHLCVDEARLSSPKIMKGVRRSSTSAGGKKSGDSGMSLQDILPLEVACGAPSMPTTLEGAVGGDIDTRQLSVEWGALLTRLSAPLPPKERAAVMASLLASTSASSPSPASSSECLFDALQSICQEGSLPMDAVEAFIERHAAEVDAVISYLMSSNSDKTGSFMLPKTALPEAAATAKKTTIGHNKNAKVPTITTTSATTAVAKQKHAQAVVLYPQEEDGMVDEGSGLTALLGEICSGDSGDAHRQRRVEEYVRHLSAAVSGSTGIPPLASCAKPPQGLCKFVGRQRPESALASLFHGTATSLTVVRCFRCCEAYHPTCYLKSTGIIPTLTAPSGSTKTRDVVNDGDDDGQQQSQQFDESLTQIASSVVGSSAGVQATRRGADSPLRCLVGWHLYAIRTLVVPVLQLLHEERTHTDADLSNSVAAEIASPSIRSPPALGLELEGGGDGKGLPTSPAVSLAPGSQGRNFSLPPDDDATPVRPPKPLFTSGEAETVEGPVVAKLRALLNRLPLKDLHRLLMPPPLHEVVPCQVCLSQLVADRVDDDSSSGSSNPYDLPFRRVLSSDAIVASVLRDAGIAPLPPNNQCKRTDEDTPTLADTLVAKILVNGFATVPLDLAHGSPVLEGLKTKMDRCFDELQKQYILEESTGRCRDAANRQEATISLLEARLSNLSQSGPNAFEYLRSDEEATLRRQLRSARRADTSPPASLGVGYANFRARGEGRYEIVEGFAEDTIVPILRDCSSLQGALGSLLRCPDDITSPSSLLHVDSRSPPLAAQIVRYYAEVAGSSSPFSKLSSGCFYATTEAQPQNWHSDGPVLIQDLTEVVVGRGVASSPKAPATFASGSAVSDNTSTASHSIPPSLITPALAPYAINIFVPLVPVDHTNGTEFRPMSHLTASARMAVREAMSAYPCFNAAAFDSLILCGATSRTTPSSPKSPAVGASGKGKRPSSPIAVPPPRKPVPLLWQTNPSHTVVPTCDVGSCLLFDYRVFHRGLGNKGRVGRPCVYVSYGRKWYRDAYNFSTSRYSSRLLLPQGWELSLSDQRTSRRMKRQRARDEEAEDGNNRGEEDGTQE